MNPIGNNILPTYLGNYGSSYTCNNNIPNPWAMIPNHYYLRNHPLTFSNTPELVAYPSLNMISIEIAITRGNQGVQASMMTPPVTTIIGRFSTKNLVPYFQPPTRNPPLGFSNFGGGIRMGGNGNPFHGSGGPLRRVNKPLGRGGGPLSEGGLSNGGGPPSGKGLPRGGGAKFPIGGTCVPFGVPWCEYLLHTFTTKVCTHIKPGWKWNYYVVVV
jgi:hypothetical protein